MAIPSFLLFVIAGLDPAIHRNKGNPDITNGRHSGMVR
jgi:hypothetical protein